MMRGRKTERWGRDRKRKEVTGMEERERGQVVRKSEKQRSRREGKKQR